MINGHRFSWNSGEFRFNGLLMVGVKSLNYKRALKGGLVRGVGPNPIGRTAGEAEYTGDFEILRLEYENLMASLGGVGVQEVVFPITAKFSEGFGLYMVNDLIPSVRIEEEDFSNAQGTDASMVKCSFSSLNMLINGTTAVAPRGVGLL
jgi:hypothetical protein